jgi:hypothetical protein
MSDLDRDLRALGTAVDWPETPDVAGTVRTRLPGQRVLRRRVARPRPAWLVILVLALIPASAAAITPARTAILRTLGLSSTIRVVELKRLPLPAHTRLVDQLGPRVTLARARLLADFRVKALPTAPRTVRFSDALLGGLVTLEYPDALIMQFAGRSTEYLQKLVAPPARARRVRVGGLPGIFISGGPTQLLLADRHGEITAIGGVPINANVLLWDAHGIGYRLQTHEPLAVALQLARTLR